MVDLDSLLEPIDGDDPAGPYLRYDPVYDEIKQARQEDPVLPQGEWKRERKVADWSKVVSTSASTLAERSKDLQLAAWLTEGLLHREGFPGLETGLRLFIRLHEEFWDHIHPQVEDPDDLEFRAVPLEWIGQYLEPALLSATLNGSGHTLADYNEARRMGSEEDAEDNADKKAAREKAIDEGRPVIEDFYDAFDDTPKPWVREMSGAVEGSREALAELDALCEEKYEGVAPSFLGLRESLEEISRITSRLMERKLEQDPDPVEVAPATEEGDAGDTDHATSASPGAAEEGTGSGGGGSSPRSGSVAAPDSADGAAQALAGAAAWLRSNDPSNPAPYLILRGYRWGELRTADDELDPRLLEAPPTATRTKLKSLLLDRKWEELLEAAETVMATTWGRGWLDLQRYVVTALQNLGRDYDPVVDAVCQSIRGLLEARPGLVDLTLMDDSPTANRETLQWLDDTVLPGGEEGGTPSSVAARASRSSPGDADKRARDRLRSGDPQQAIQLLMNAAARENSARERFLRRSEATRIMVDQGMEEVALPILQEMMDQVERHSLEEWESGNTVAQPMSLLHGCMERMDRDEGLREELYLRICRLDPMEGMKLKGGGAVNTNAVEDGVDDDD